MTFFVVNERGCRRNKNYRNPPPFPPGAFYEERERKLYLFRRRSIFHGNGENGENGEIGYLASPSSGKSKCSLKDKNFYT